MRAFAVRDGILTWEDAYMDVEATPRIIALEYSRDVVDTAEG